MKKYTLLGVSVVVIIVSAILYIAFPNPTFTLSDEGAVIKQDYRWIIHVAYSIAVGLFFGIFASITISKKSMKRFEKVAVVAAAILAGGVVFATRVCIYQFNNVNWPWEYLTMFTIISVTASLITALSFKEPSYFPSDDEMSLDIEKGTEEKRSFPDISFEAKSEGNEIANLRFMYDKFVQNMKPNSDEANADYNFDIKDKYKLSQDQKFLLVKINDSTNQYVIFRKKDNELFIDEIFSMEGDIELMCLVLEKLVSGQGASKVTIILPDYEKLKRDLIYCAEKYSDYNYTCKDEELSFEVR